MKKTYFFTLCLCLFLVPINTRAEDQYRIFQVGRFDAGVDLKYFKTESNYEANGTKQRLSAGSSLQDIQFSTTARYVWFTKLGIYTGINFGNVESVNSTNTRTNSRMNYFFAGGDYQIAAKDNWSLFADISYHMSNEQIDVNGDTSLSSDGASEFKAQAVGVVKLSSFSNYANIGFNYRTEGLSTLMTYGAGIDYNLNHFSIGGEIQGFSTIKDDEETATPLNRENLTTRVNAGSKRYYAINPNLLEAILNLSYSPDSSMKFSLGVGSTILGSNSADGLFMKTSINWGFGASKNQMKSKQPPEIESVENKTSLPDDDPAFKIETNDGVDQNLFKPSEPVKRKK